MHPRKSTIYDWWERKDITIGIRDERIFRQTFYKMSKPYSLWVLFNYFPHGQRLSEIQRHKAEVRIHCLVFERRLDVGHVMHTNGDLFTVASDGPVQVFLQVHEGFYRGRSELHASDNCAPQNRSDIIYCSIFIDLDTVRSYLIFAKPFLDSKEAAHGPCGTLNAV